jgi:hypothetical protein
MTILEEPDEEQNPLLTSPVVTLFVLWLQNAIIRLNGSGRAVRTCLLRIISTAKV